MSDRSKIEWTDASWNPLRARRVIGAATGTIFKQKGAIGWHCEHVSEGCRNCYAEAINRRLGTGLDFKPGHRADLEFFLDEKTLVQPLHWKKPRKIFPCSMTDLFGDWVTDVQLDRIFAVMALCPQHTFQVLTKRPERMRAYWVGEHSYRDVHPLENRVNNIADAAGRLMEDGDNAHDCVLNLTWPLPNVWLGVSCEDQATADARIPLLLQTPAAVRFISAEPLLGHVALHALNLATASPSNALLGVRCVPDASPAGYHNEDTPRLDWVIVGGESGPNARPMHPQRARDLRDWCKATDVAFFFKQWGEFLPVGQHLPGCGKIHGATAVKAGRMKLHYAGTPQQEPKHAFAERGVEIVSTADGRLTFRVGKKRAGRLLDGIEHNAFPESAR